MNASLNEQVASYSGIGRPRLKGQQLPNPKTWTTNKKTKWKRIKLNLYGKQMTLLVLTRKCLWYTATGQRLVHVLVTRDPKGNYEDRAFFSTNPNANPAQLLGLADPQNGFSRGRKEPGRPKPGPQLRGSHGQKA
ncbi:MAG: hypothetical protein GY930_18300, partial [bacterium]|nr:hypothetical protein [bacterium]